MTPAQVLSPLTTKRAVGILENCHWGLNLAEKFKLSVPPSTDESQTRKSRYALGVQPNTKRKKKKGKN